MPPQTPDTQTKTEPAKPKANSIVVLGRRWFNKNGGSTYHSAAISVDGQHVHQIDYKYGYGGQYVDSAAAWLYDNGYMPGRKKNESSNSWESLWVYCERMGIDCVYSATDVQRKKDL